MKFYVCVVTIEVTYSVYYMYKHEQVYLGFPNKNMLVSVPTVDVSESIFKLSMIVNNSCLGFNLSF